MRRLAALLLAVAIAVSGCAGTRALFTNPTGLITIERQEFVNTYAIVKVLYRRMYVQAQRACERGEMNCEEVALLDRTARQLAVRIDAKIETPESEIDWAVVKDMLGILVGLVP